jgi:hypothetical protein
MDGSHGVAAHPDDPHPGRESSVVGEQRAVEPGLDCPRQLLGVAEVHRVRRPVDDRDRQVLGSEPAHLVNSGPGAA